MKFIKNFKLFENKSINDLNIKVIDAQADNNYGGVQIDEICLTVNNIDYYFELATTIGKDSYVKYLSSENDSDDDDFVSHFKLEVETYMKSIYDKPKESDSYFELKDFISECAYDSNMEGEETEIDGFDIKITNISHNGGKEFGHLFVSINGNEFYLDMEQDATGPGLDSIVTYASDDDEKIGKENGLNLDDDETQSFFFHKYDTITAKYR
jgi:hypothetical protein